MYKLFVLFIFISLNVEAFEAKLFQKITDIGTVNKVFSNLFTDNRDIKFILKKSTYYKNIKYLHYGYSYKNIPVDNQTIVISLKDNKPYFIFGNFKIPSLDLKARFSPLKVFENFKSKTEKFRFYSDIKKVYLIKDGKSYLTYKSWVEYIDKTGFHLGEIYINAENSEVVLFKSHIYKALRREIYTFNNVCLADQNSYEALPGDLVISEGQNDVADNVVQDAYDNTGITYWFYKNMFNRDSFDNNGIKLVSTVHATFDFNDGWGCIGGNAFFMGYPFDQMVYGDGDDTMYYLSQALDITAHELTHAVTDKTSGLYYNGESGALNEAMSDIFGATAEAWADSGGNAGGNPQNFTANDDNWKIGEDVMVNGMAMRYMNNPHLAEGPNEYKPDHYSQRYIGGYDEGGVHINSTIISLAYYLLVTGGNHPRSEFQNIYPDVIGIGLEKAIKIFYHAQTHYFTSDTDFDFRDARRLLSLSAEDLYGNCSNESEQVNRAFDIVGVPGDRRDECGGSGNNPCTGMECPLNSHCDVNDNNEALCYCNQGYHAEDTDGDGQYDSCVINDNGVCTGVDCAGLYPNSVCIEYQGGPACACPDGWDWNQEQTECVDLGLEVCENVTCSYHGVCVNEQGVAKCICDEGYHLEEMNCIEDGDEDVCQGVTCSGHGICEDRGNGAVCNCDGGYEAQGLECVEIEVNPCEGITCSNHGVCKIQNNQAYCYCDEGYVKGENYTCIEDNKDLCKEVTCSEHGTCVVYQNKAACLCDNGYVVSGLECLKKDKNNNDKKSGEVSSCSYSERRDYSFVVFIFAIIFVFKRYFYSKLLK